MKGRRKDGFYKKDGENGRGRGVGKRKREN